MEKLYVNFENNKCPEYLLNHFPKGCKVIVVDGSYMTARSGEVVYGTTFRKNGFHELLTITRVNIPFKTAYDKVVLNDVLGYHNNCEIMGNDGKVYYCSKINIVRFDM